MHARAILVRSLFAVSWIYSRFVRAITRFQRKFSVNHAKSAYFQRKFKKSAQINIYHINDARPAVEKPQWAGILHFQTDWNPLPMISLECNRQISRRMDTHGIIVVERFATFHYY